MKDNLLQVICGPRRVLTNFMCISLGIAGAMGRGFGQDTHSAGWVVIPVSEYERLRDRVFPAQREPEPPPVDATLSRVDYEIQVQGARRGVQA